MIEIIRWILIISGIVGVITSVVIEDDRWFRTNVIIILFYILIKP